MYGSKNNNNIYVTINGGSSWTNKLVGAYRRFAYFGISCAKSTDCVVVGGGGVRQVTTDSGTTWPRQNFNAFQNLIRVNCPDTTACYATGSDGSGGTVMKSSDGGNAWVQQLSTLDALYGISCLDANICYVAGGNSSAATSKVVKTTDGGKTWAIFSIPGSVIPTSITCLDANTCIAVSNQIIKTSNGGTNWTIPFPSGANSYSFSSVVCPDTTTCFALAFNNNNFKGVFLKSTDRGDSWVSPAITVPFTFAGNINCFSSKVCYVSGAGIYKTTDGGLNWSTQPANIFLNSMSCIDINNCYGVGNNGLIAVTDDGGLNWTPQNSGMNRRLYDINCSYGCITVGDGGTILSNTLTVTSPSEDGLPASVNTPGKLSYALNRARAGQNIFFGVNGNLITLDPSTNLPPVQNGVNLVGGCGANGPTVTIDGQHTSTGLTLSGHNSLSGIKLVKLIGPVIKNTGTGNKLHCVVAQH